MNPNHIGAEEVEFFQENGYLQIPGFYSKREIAELADALDKTVEEKRTRILGGGGETDDDYNRVFNQMVNLWVDHEATTGTSRNAMPRCALSSGLLLAAM